MAKKISTSIGKKKATPIKKAVASKKKATPVKKAASVKKVATRNAPAKTVRKKTSKPATNEALQKLHNVIIDAIQDKKAKDIVSLDLRSITDSVADYFIICTGEVGVQSKAIADNAAEMVHKKMGEKPWHSEGFGNMEWIIIDFVNIVLHIFNPKTRDFYELEELWADADKIEFE